MADIIKHKRSATAAAVPTAGQLSLGELAINTADGKVYLKKSDGSVVLLGSDKEAAIADGTTTQYWRGDKTWQDLAAAVRAALLTDLSTASSADVAATDTVLAAIGKLQTGKVPRDSATGAARLPAGTTAQRPAGALGDFRRNTTAGKWEWHDGTSWIDLEASIGAGQAMVDVSGSRGFGVTYTNTTGRPIVVYLSVNTGPGAPVPTATFYIGDIIAGRWYNDGPRYGPSLFIIPAGATYRLQNIQGSLSIIQWAELR